MKRKPSIASNSHKYRAKPTVVDGIHFSSLKEAKRYGELKLLQRNGKISDLRLQPSFPIVIDGEKICTYIADFQYMDMQSKLVVVEDVKTIPTMTPVYRLKKKLMKLVNRIEITEVT